jgi:hypothetical protein
LIYGDLSVADVAEQDLPAPVEKTPKVVLKYQQWDKDNFVGFERDIWHITADGQILAESIINIRKGPVDKDIMTITLPYGGGQLESVTLADANLPFNKITDRRYEIQLPLEKLFEGKTSIKCTWTMPFDSLEQAETGLRTILRSLIPVGSYRLIIALDTDCGYQFSSDAQKRRKLVFSWNSSEKTKGYFGSCGIPIRKIE